MPQNQCYNGVSQLELAEAIEDARIKAKVKYYRLPGRARQSCLVSIEDLTGVALLGVAKAIHSYDKSRGVPFKHYAGLRAWSEILDYFRDIDFLGRDTRIKYRKAGIKIPAPFELDAKLPRTSASSRDPEETPLGLGCMESKEKCQYNLFQEQELAQIINIALPTRTAFIMHKYYFEDFSDLEIGKLIGVNESRTNKIRNGALKTLRAFINGTQPAKTKAATA